MEWGRVTETERMPSLIGGNTELFGAPKAKNRKGFKNRTTEPGPNSWEY
jgi:hypothetical protein